jgi:hypothetical protein
VKTVLVSGADARYFPLLRDLVHSVRARLTREAVDVAILDAGLAAGQREELSPLVDRFAEPDWDLRPRGKAPGYVRLFESRPFLTRYFPGYELYVWIDADAWLQDAAAFDLLARGANRGALAIVAELHPAYDPVLPALRLRYRKLGRMRFESWAHWYYRDGYGEQAARDFALRPLLNSGVFALLRDAPHWEAWIESYRAAKPRRHRVGFDQIALNHAVYSKGLPLECLPAWCNWACSRGLPAVDEASGLLVDPCLPHDPLGLVHMTWNAKEGDHLLPTTGGGTRLRSLRYPGMEPQP